jgi:hypothetical protein
MSFFDLMEDFIDWTVRNKWADRFIMVFAILWYGFLIFVAFYLILLGASKISK